MASEQVPRMLSREEWTVHAAGGAVVMDVERYSLSCFDVLSMLSQYAEPLLRSCHTKATMLHCVRALCSDDSLLGRYVAALGDVSRRELEQPAPKIPKFGSEVGGDSGEDDGEGGPVSAGFYVRLNNLQALREKLLEMEEELVEEARPAHNSRPALCGVHS